MSLALVALGLGGCGRAPSAHAISGATMGTTYTVKAVSDTVDVAVLRDQIDTALVNVNAAMSTYLPDSELSRFNASASTDWFAVSSELCELVKRALRLSINTGGAFDVTVGPLVNLWGFGPEGMRSKPPEDQELEAVVAQVGYTHVHTDCDRPALRKELPGVYVDLSAIAKGYAVDRVAGIVEEAGVSDYLVEVGGELKSRGNNARGDAWSVAIETPQREGRAVQTIVELTDAAVATSGDYRNFYEHDGKYFSHTIDPRTGRPVSHNLASVTVVAKTAEAADGLATAMLVLGPDEGLQLAEKRQVAAYFLVRGGAGVEALSSAIFKETVVIR